MVIGLLFGFGSQQRMVVAVGLAEGEGFRTDDPKTWRTTKIKHTGLNGSVVVEGSRFNSVFFDMTSIPLRKVNVKRTFWSPKWSRTRSHGHGLGGTRQHARPIFPIPINTCRDRTKRVETATNEF